MAFRIKIIIVNGEKNTASILYRSDAAERCLKMLGLDVVVHEVDDIDKIKLEEVTACLFIRTPLTPAVGAFIERLRSLYVAVLADFDDLIFCPELVHLYDGIKYLSNDERILFTERTYQFQEMVKISDCVIVTTLPLAYEATRYNKHVRVIKNYPLTVTRNASIYSEEKQYNHDKFVIGYYSGTLTHQADFIQCANALVKLMEKRSEVELRIVGKMNLDEFSEIQKFDSRLTQIPIMPYQDMLFDLRGCDLNLAPLELGNVFCESKSELKYFDSGLMCVPTIASPTKPFKAAIRHGVNGFLAESQQDWFDCFNNILNDKEVVKRVGLTARRYVLSFFGESAQLNDYRRLMRLVVEEIRAG